MALMTIETIVVRSERHHHRGCQEEGRYRRRHRDTDDDGDGDGPRRPRPGKGLHFSFVLFGYRIVGHAHKQSKTALFRKRGITGFLNFFLEEIRNACM